MGGAGLAEEGGEEGACYPWAGRGWLRRGGRRGSSTSLFTMSAAAPARETKGFISWSNQLKLIKSDLTSVVHVAVHHERRRPCPRDKRFFKVLKGFKIDEGRL